MYRIKYEVLKSITKFHLKTENRCLEEENASPSQLPHFPTGSRAEVLFTRAHNRQLMGSLVSRISSAFLDLKNQTGGKFEHSFLRTATARSSLSALTPRTSAMLKEPLKAFIVRRYLTISFQQKSTLGLIQCPTCAWVTSISWVRLSGFPSISAQHLCTSTVDKPIL